MNTPKKARSLELFFVNGDPEGMLTASIPFQWSGHVLVTKRTELRAALNRPEAARPGIYLLIGEQNGEPLLYIGESDDIGQRIKTHDANKDWWHTAVFVTSSGDQLNKAHVKYLESRLIEVAKSIQKIKLDNLTQPPLNALSEAARAHMEDFLENLLLVLPALRFDFLIESTRPKSSVNQDIIKPSTVFVLNSPKYQVSATACIQNGYFVVEAGSTARASWQGAGAGTYGYAKLHAGLIAQGVLVAHGKECVFAKSYAFNSPSAAGAVVNGRSTNGTVEWKVKDSNQTYKDWEAEEILNSRITP